MHDYLFTGKRVNPYILYNTWKFTENSPPPSTITFILTKILYEWQYYRRHKSGQGLLEGWPEQPYRIPPQFLFMLTIVLSDRLSWVVFLQHKRILEGNQGRFFSHLL